MDPDADLASVAALIADRNRAQMLLALLGGAPQSGSALAEAAGISRSLASAHLRKLVDGGFVKVRPSGRQRLYSIASEPVADALEILTLLAPASPARTLKEASRARNLRWARMCYDHLAGTVGVTLTAALLGRGLMLDSDGGYLLGSAGPAGFGEIGIDVSQLERRTRPLLRACMDWSERQYHLAGSLGAALSGTMLDRKWIARREASRIVTVTPAGAKGLRDWLGVDLDQLRAAA
ncbi:MAG: helix-turn-helix transcriptional regulator [Streptosporangiaceae bacterium]|nr:helix-turn-helix transcriptional regulator [Streptosporangiaceae bacterium]